jgi:hypothetical protein
VGGIRALRVARKEMKKFVVPTSVGLFQKEMKKFVVPTSVGLSVIPPTKVGTTNRLS